MSKSVNRWMTRSVFPPKYADATPMMVPPVQPMNDDQNPIDSAVLAP